MLEDSAPRKNYYLLARAIAQAGALVRTAAKAIAPKGQREAIALGSIALGTGQRALPQSTITGVGYADFFTILSRYYSY
ncbi:hypothetical protein [Allocoleopsis sp.]|uniref:hypothetical protein n=1 Tax=Allocoleopsis sp. TaxID=3088169 RepID=UPI002FD030A0